MAGNLIINGDTATVSFTYTADVAKAQAVIENYGIQIYPQFPVYDGNNEVIPFDQLTAQQKVDVVDQKVRYDIMLGARNNLVDDAVNQARVDAYADDSIELA